MIGILILLIIGFFVLDNLIQLKNWDVTKSELIHTIDILYIIAIIIFAAFLFNFK